MEDTTKVTDSTSPEANDKTTLMGSNQGHDSTKSEEVPKTQVGNSTEGKTESSPEPKEAEGSSSKEFLAEAKTKSAAPKVIAAAAAAAVVSGGAGVALGATYSEEIKEVMANPLSEEEAMDSATVAEAEEVSAINGDEIFVASEAVESAGNFSTLEFSGADQEGNVYSVSFLDMEGDGQFESQTIEFETVDGFSISYTEFGDSLDPFFGSDYQLADNSAYVQEGFCNVQEVSMMDSYLYEIQPGDTLSELAAANNTSVAHLMELNPQISDPDLIYAGNNLILPDGDSFVESYEALDEAYEATFIAEGDSYFVDEAIAETPTGDFAAIDWESFYDNPVSNPYTTELDGMDFEAMETPQSYYETDYEMGDFGMEDSGFGFL